MMSKIKLLLDVEVMLNAFVIPHLMRNLLKFSKKIPAFAGTTTIHNHFNISDKSDR